MTDLAFNIAALDNASKTFLKVAQQVEKLADKLDQLDRKSAEPRIDVDTARVDRKLDTTSRKVDTLASGFSGSLIKVVAFSRALGAVAIPPALIAGTGALIPLLAGVAAGAATASGSLLLLPAAGAAAATGLGALSVATSGVGDAIKAMMAVESAGAASGMAHAAALRVVEDAQRNLSRTIEDGADRIADAERAVARAQETALDAQQDLNRAREEAAERIRDLQLELRGAALSEEEAALGVADAQQRLAEAAAKGSGSLDFRRAELSLRRAQLRLEETRESYADLSEEAERAARAGVEGDERVRSAHDRVADATEGIETAQRNLGRAVRDVAQAQEDALRRLAQAQEALAAGGGVELDQALAKLSPNARAFVLALQDAKSAFDDLRLDVQDRLFAGLAGRVDGLAGMSLPILGAAFGSVADSANGALHEIGDLLLERAADFDLIGQSGADVFDDLSEAAAPLIAALVDITAVGAEILAELTDGTGDAAQGFADFIAEARESGQLAEWIRDGLDALKAFGHFLATVGSIASGVFEAASAGATGVLGPLSELLDGADEWVHSFEGQDALQTFFAAGSRIVAALLPLLGDVAEIIGTVVAPALADLVEEASPGLAVFIRALGMGLAALAEPGESGASAMQLLGQAASDVMDALAPVLPVLGTELAQALTILAPELDDVALALADVLIALAPYLPELTELAVDLLPLVIGALDSLADTLDVLEEPVSAVIDAFSWLMDLLLPLADDIFSLSNPVLLVTDTLQGLGETAPQAWHEFTAAFDRAKDAVGRHADAMVDRLAGLPARIWNATSGMFDGIKDAFRNSVNWIIGKWNSLSFGFPSVDIPGIGRVGGATLSTPDIPYLDVGGRILQTGLAMVHTGEQVVPAAKTAPLAGGGRVVELRAGDDFSRVLLDLIRKAVGDRGGDVTLVLAGS
ncbi:MAG: hypothetical protein ACREXJ_00180 [Gammaproteobacteria bacterium]